MSTANASIFVIEFLIEGALCAVRATVNGRTGFLPPLFNLIQLNRAGPITADLTINETLWNALIDALLGGGPGTEDSGPSGTVLGLTVTTPAPVPRPASSLFVLAGIGGFAVMRRKAKAAA